MAPSFFMLNPQFITPLIPLNLRGGITYEIYSYYPFTCPWRLGS